MLRTYLQYKPAWMQLLIFVIMALLISNIGIGIALPIISSTTGISLTEMENIISGKAITANAKYIMVWVQLLQFFLLFLIPSLLMGYFSSPTPQRFLGLHHFGKPIFFGTVIVLVFACLATSGLLVLINEQLPMPTYFKKLEVDQNKMVEALALAKTPIDLVLSLILVGLFAAIGEELFFRSVLQRIIIQWTKAPIVGIIITAIVFSAIHLQFSGFLVRFGLGMVLGLLYWYSGSIWVNILFHFIYNGIGVLAAYNNPKVLQQNSATALSTTGTIILGVIAIVILVLVLYYLRKRSDTTYPKVYPKPPNFFD